MRNWRVTGSTENATNFCSSEWGSNHWPPAYEANPNPTQRSKKFSRSSLIQLFLISLMITPCTEKPWISSHQWLKGSEKFENPTWPWALEISEREMRGKERAGWGKGIVKFSGPCHHQWSFPEFALALVFRKIRERTTENEKKEKKGLLRYHLTSRRQCD